MENHKVYRSICINPKLRSSAKKSFLRKITQVKVRNRIGLHIGPKKHILSLKKIPFPPFRDTQVFTLHAPFLPLLFHLLHLFYFSSSIVPLYRNIHPWPNLNDLTMITSRLLRDYNVNNSIV
jgi:hypothetical protein